MPTPEELLKNLPPNELLTFVLKQAQCNDTLRKAILLEFAPKAKNKSGNPYSAILRNALKKTRFHEDDMWQYDDCTASIDAMDDLLEKAKSFVMERKYDNAVSIAKACIEEFSSWYITQDDNVCDYIDSDYSERPFTILGEIAEENGCDAEVLYRYCETELIKDKYAAAGMRNGFNALLLSLAKKTGNMEFLAFQDKLLGDAQDKSSYEAERILEHKMDFYRATGNPEMADEILEANLQIDSFRRAMVEKLIATGNFAKAKALILQTPLPDRFSLRHSWEELLLTIARKENDIHKIREIAFSFIENSFNKEYYDIYKSAFSAEEWKDEVERLIRHYEPKAHDWSSDYIADVLSAEGMTTRLLDYIANHLTLNRLTQYYMHICEHFPEETLLLFRKAADSYADKNVGEKYYETIASVLRRMRKIPNGDGVVREMIVQYRLLYKRRSAMMRILNSV